MSTMSLFRIVVVTVVCLSLLSCAKEEPITPNAQVVAVGGLFSITGNWNTLGKAGNAAAELAVIDANAYFASIGSSTRVTYQNYDTKLDPATALEGMKYMQGHLVRLVVGPQSSAEVSAIKNYADSAGILVISPSSTAGALAIANDNILRMCPSDAAEGPAIAAMMKAEGRTNIIPVWRDDIGNNGLKTSASAALVASGATVQPGMSYATDVVDFTSLVNTLRATVSAQIAVSGKEKVAIYNPGFDEVVNLFAAIPPDDSVLRGVRWYGGDGTAMSAALFSQADFITQVSYPNPLFGIGDGAAIAGSVAQRIKARSGVDADAYSLSVYDAVRIAAASYPLASHIGTIAAVREAFILEAGSTFGVTGWTKLNEFGDREFGNFDMMAVRIVGGSPAWVRIGKYSSGTGVYTPE